MKHIKLYEQYVNENKFKFALADMDVWMPEDPDLQDEYYALQGAGDVEELASFFDEFADHDVLSQRYKINSRDLEKLAKTAIEM